MLSNKGLIIDNDESSLSIVEKLDLYVILANIKSQRHYPALQINKVPHLITTAPGAEDKILGVVHGESITEFVTKDSKIIPSSRIAIFDTYDSGSRKDHGFFIKLTSPLDSQIGGWQRFNNLGGVENATGQDITISLCIQRLDNELLSYTPVIASLFDESVIPEDEYVFLNASSGFKLKFNFDNNSWHKIN